MRASTLLFRGQKQRREGRCAEAVETLSRAVERAGASAHVALHRALALADAGRPDEALECLEDGARRWPRNPVFPLFRAAVLVENERLDEAGPVLVAARALSPGNLLVHAYAALAAMRRGDVAGPLRRLGAVGLTDNARALGAILTEVEAELFRQFGVDADASTPELEDLGEPSGRLRRAGAARLAADGLACLERGDAVGGWQRLSLAAEKNPSLPDVFTHLACACFDLGLYEKALEHLGRVGEWSSSLEVAHLHRGASLYKVGRFEEAIEALRAAHEADELGEYATWVHFYRGRALIAAGRRAEARGEFRRFVELEGDLALARLHQARQLLGLEVADSAPKGFVVRETGRTVLVVRPGLEDAVRARRPAADGGPARAGRGPIERIELPDGVGLVRQCRRGGIFGGILGGIHLDGKRFLREVGVADALGRRGVATPQVAAGCRHEVAPGLYRMAVVTREESGARDLAEALGALDGGDAAAAARRELLEAVARLVRQLHDAGLHHADLNARNILIVADGSAMIIDLDRAELRDALSARQRTAMLARLYRSLHKLGLAPEPVTEEDWAAFYAAYAGESAELRGLGGRVLACCRREVRRHRLWWKLTGHRP